MSRPVRLFALFFSLIISIVSASSQQTTAAAKDGSIHLDVLATSKGGGGSADLQQSDFTILDNKVPRPVTSFHAWKRSEAPVHVILVVDTVNTPYQTLIQERAQINKFLGADNGSLTRPTTLAIFADKGFQMLDGSAQDGKALGAYLDKYAFALRSRERSESFYGGTERYELSQAGLRQLATREATLPGRKVVIWISPGWPYLQNDVVQNDPKQQQKVFADIVSMSTLLRNAQIALYSIDPVGAGAGLGRASLYQPLFKGVTKFGQAQFGHLGLEVLVNHTGGLILGSSNNIEDLLQKAVLENEIYYELTFDAAHAERPNEYHRIEIQVAKSGLGLRTSDGYYAQP